MSFVVSGALHSGMLKDVLVLLALIVGDHV